MSMFVMVTDDSGFRYAINVDRILWISPDACNVCMSVTNEQWECLTRIRPEDIKRLLVMTGVADHDTD